MEKAKGSLAKKWVWSRSTICLGEEAICANVYRRTDEVTRKILVSLTLFTRDRLACSVDHNVHPNRDPNLSWVINFDLWARPPRPTTPIQIWPRFGQTEPSCHDAERYRSTVSSFETYRTRIQTHAYTARRSHTTRNTINKECKRSSAW